MADELDDGDETFDDELVEGVIGRVAMAVLYGDSNSGKTFLAIDIGAAVARAQAWMGRNVAGGLVVYLATEAANSVRLRLRAYQRFHGVRVPGFAIVQSPINLYDGEADIVAVLTLISQIEARLGIKCSLIIGDTLARISAGANENSGQDMGVVMQNTSAIISATGASFLWIHHTGKDQAKGMRGWSGMRAAIETEIEITADEATGSRVAEITKQRDLPGKGDRYGFRLESVMLGSNLWGRERGSCVVVSTDAPAKRQAKRQSEIAGAIVEFLSARGTGCLKGRVVEHFADRYVKSSVYKEIKKMVMDGRLIEAGGIVALPGLPRGAE
nr:helicase RepA family protein [Schlegelella koreensis]